MEEREQWAREEKERTRREEKEDAKSRERRGGMAMGSPMLGVVGEKLAPGGGGGDIAIAAAAALTARAAAQMRSSRISDVRRKVTRGIENMPRKGEDSPPQDTREFGSRGSRGATTKLALEIFLSS